MPAKPSQLNNIETIEWYFSVLSNKEQNLDKNIKFSKNLAILIKDTLSQKPYCFDGLINLNKAKRYILNERRIINSSEVEYSRKYGGEITETNTKLQLEAELEYVGRGEVSPICSRCVSGIDAFDMAENLALDRSSNGSHLGLSELRKKPISSSSLKGLLPYVILLITSKNIISMDTSIPVIAECLKTLTPDLLRELTTTHSLDDFFDQTTTPEFMDTIASTLEKMKEIYKATAEVITSPKPSVCEQSPPQTFFAERPSCTKPTFTVSKPKQSSCSKPSFFKHYIELLISLLKKAMKAISEYLFGPDRPKEPAYKEVTFIK
jgi:hypothetical protein